MPITAIRSIQYVGEPGVTKECLDAVVRFVQFGDRISRTRILTDRNEHALLLTIGVGDLVAVKSGFTSGYAGEGPRGFSFVLQLLDSHGSEIEEHDVDAAVIQRIDASALKSKDLNAIEKAPQIRPSRWYDYVDERHYEKSKDGTLWQDLPTVMPFALIDPRLIDLAIRFCDSPDDCLLTAYRRLEDAVRRRTGIDQHGSKLFSEAFLGTNARLRWPDTSSGENAGRASLFTATYGAYRNPRAHKELPHDSEKMLMEFLAVNHLFRLESEAEEMPGSY